MICSRRLYKGNSYEICLPLKYSGVTGVNIYTDGAVKIPVTPEISGDTLCFEITSEDLDVLADGVLRYELITDSEVSDSNSRFVVKTPEGYSAQTLDTLLEEAYQSGYTAGGEGGFESGYTSGYTDGYESGYTGGYDSGYTDGHDSGYTDGYAEGYDSGYTSGYTDGYESGYTDGGAGVLCYEDYYEKFLTFEIISAGTINFKTTSANFTRTIEYSKDMGATWSSITSTVEGVQIPVEAGDTVKFKGGNYYPAGMGRNTSVYTTFSGTTAVFNAYGNVNSIVYNPPAEDGYIMPLYQDNAVFCGLFKGVPGLISAEYLILPATFASKWCHYEMFMDCTGLEIPPRLPAQVLADYCYQKMFYNCTSLTYAPTLNAINLAVSCYSSMFEGCTSLVQYPELPATTLYRDCYSAMFKNCSNIVTGGGIKATTLAEWCFYQMFYGCSKLRSDVGFYATEFPANSCAQMYYGCSSLTRAIIYCEVLTNGCFDEMFRNCSNLNTIWCTATDISATNCTRNWVRGVSSSGTFKKDANMTSWTTGVNGIPSGWSVQDI